MSVLKSLVKKESSVTTQFRNITFRNVFNPTIQKEKGLLENRHKLQQLLSIFLKNVKPPNIETLLNQGQTGKKEDKSKGKQKHKSKGKQKDEGDPEDQGDEGDKRDPEDPEDEDKSDLNILFGDGLKRRNNKKSANPYMRTLNVLIGSKNAGNDSKLLTNMIYGKIEEGVKRGILSNRQAQQILQSV